MEIRDSMVSLINDFRAATGADQTDVFQGQNFWSDEQLQAVLDSYRRTLYAVKLTGAPRFVGGTNVYTEYTFNTRGGLWFEPIYVVRDSNGNTVAGSITVSTYDRSGVIQFSTDQAGATLTVDLIIFDWHAAAGDVWGKKASQRYDYINVKAGDHKFDAESEYKHCVEQRDFHRSKRIRSFSWSSSKF